MRRRCGNCCSVKSGLGCARRSSRYALPRMLPPNTMLPRLTWRKYMISCGIGARHADHRHDAIGHRFGHAHDGTVRLHRHRLAEGRAELARPGAGADQRDGGRNGRAVLRRHAEVERRPCGWPPPRSSPAPLRPRLRGRTAERRSRQAGIGMAVVRRERTAITSGPRNGKRLRNSLPPRISRSSPQRRASAAYFSMLAALLVVHHPHVAGRDELGVVADQLRQPPPDVARAVCQRQLRQVSALPSHVAEVDAAGLLADQAAFQQHDREAALAQEEGAGGAHRGRRQRSRRRPASCLLLIAHLRRLDRGHRGRA